MPTSDSSTLDIQKLLKAIKYNACNRNKVSQNLDRVKYSQPVNIVKKGITCMEHVIDLGYVVTGDLVGALMVVYSII